MDRSAPRRFALHVLKAPTHDHGQFVDKGGSNESPSCAMPISGVAMDWWHRLPRQRDADGVAAP